MFHHRDKYDHNTMWDTFGRLRTLRAKSGLTIYEAARRAHYTSPGAVLAAEEGKTVGISLMETLERVYRKEIERLVERKAA